MTLHLISPLDGRYAETTAPLRNYFSEFAFLRDRVRVELNFLLALSKTGLIRPLSNSESAQIESILSNFSTADAELILEHERKTRHDVKAIEYFIQSKLQNSSLQDLLPWIHFGLTSEDTNSIGQAIALKESRDKVILPN
ncbi:MAG TPA: lyase family protein, partial [Anaerolineales bacterium]|nr:lyase family protein [Anaerolineales bacterium]